jgi:hypothetical protein
MLTTIRTQLILGALLIACQVACLAVFLVVEGSNAPKDLVPVGNIAIKQYAFVISSMTGLGFAFSAISFDFLVLTRATEHTSPLSKLWGIHRSKFDDLLQQYSAHAGACFCWAFTCFTMSLVLLQACLFPVGPGGVAPSVPFLLICALAAGYINCIAPRDNPRVGTHIPTQATLNPCALYCCFSRRRKRRGHRGRSYRHPGSSNGPVDFDDVETMLL